MGVWPREASALEHLATEVFPTAEVAHRSAVSFDRKVAWRTNLLALCVPYPASDTRTDAIHRVSGRLASATRPLALVSPLADGGVPVLPRFLSVSYIWYWNIYLRHLRKTGINKARCFAFGSAGQQKTVSLSKEIFWPWQVGRFLFFPLFGEPILQIFGEYFHISFLHNVVDDCGGNFELYHSLVRPLPEPALLSGCVGQIEIGYQLTELLEHYRIKVAVIA